MVDYSILNPNLFFEYYLIVFVTILKLILYMKNCYHNPKLFYKYPTTNLHFV